MFIKSIEFNNYRGFENISISFKEGINLIIGNNGAGKSSILSGTRTLLSELLMQVQGMGKVQFFDDGDVRISTLKIGDATNVYKKNWPMFIYAEFDYKNEVHTLRRGIEAEGNIEGGSYSGGNIFSDLLKEENTIIPLINFQRFDREWNRTDTKSKNLSIEMGLTDRVDGLKGTLDDTVIDNVVSKWCLKMSMIEMERNDSVKEFSTFKKIISRFMKYLLNEENDVEVVYSIEQGGVLFKTKDFSQPIINLSTGYRAVLSMIMELAYRTVVLNPTIDAELRNLEGIVMIDEIDAHLHPIWQWRIIDALRNTYPAVQFIIATHSPIILASVQEANIIKLESLQKVSYLESAYGMSADDILMLRQGSDAIPEKIKRIREKFENALIDEDDNAAQEILDSIKDEYGEEAPLYKSLKDNYDVNFWAEED